MTPHIHHVSVLDGQEIVLWRGTEMALGGGDPAMCQDASEDFAPVVWAHDSVPFLQFICIDIFLVSGKIYRLLSQLEDGTGFHGFYLTDIEQSDEDEEAANGSIYRTRAISELPVGRAAVNLLRQDGPNALIECEFCIGTARFRLLAGEVYERRFGRFEVCTPDESILLQLR